MTVRESVTELRRHLLAKRLVSAEERVNDFQCLGIETRPESAAQAADDLERLVLGFNDPALRTIAQRKLEGFTTYEIAKQMGCLNRTNITGKLNLIRQEREEAMDSTEPTKAGAL